MRQVTTRLALWLMAIVLGMFLLGPSDPAAAQADRALQSGPSNASEPPAAPKKSFLPPRPAPQKGAAPAAPPTGFFAGLYAWTAAKQRQFIGTLASSLRDIKSGNVLSASLVLIAFSFAYGILHAAGPGHGKAIVSSYILADGQTVRRGIQLAFLSAFVQALSAILIFAVVVQVMSGARSQIVSTEAWIERLSWLIVAGLGAWLLWRQLVPLIRGGSHAHAHAHAHAHEHAHPHEPAHAAVHNHAPHIHAHHDHGHHAHDHHHPTAHPPHHAGHNHAAHQHAARHNTGHDHRAHTHAAGESCAACGHTHLPAASQLQGEWSWKRAGAMALAIGIRPCTGAIGMLFVANGLGLMWAGITSAFAMALGTAITVSALAALSATSRDAAAKLAGTADNAFATRAQTAFGLAGAALVFLLGVSFFYYSLNNPSAF